MPKALGSRSKDPGFNSKPCWAPVVRMSSSHKFNESQAWEDFSFIEVYHTIFKTINKFEKQYFRTEGGPTLPISWQSLYLMRPSRACTAAFLTADLGNLTRRSNKDTKPSESANAAKHQGTLQDSRIKVNLEFFGGYWELSSIDTESHKGTKLQIITERLRLLGRNDR